MNTLRECTRGFLRGDTLVRRNAHKGRISEHLGGRRAHKGCLGGQHFGKRGLKDYGVITLVSSVG